ncbi:hypothetical protein Pan216_33820 [Planctomycetes bacterium Pan216]|uniref:Apolipoprotein A1/A4/E domain protein n=1 Tax=Kolteria novifilia TaxID=2527975 RepID=A0A518B6B2_9BACT|nr:hypothetical protein Pan216_33820 [Planctomycetes bacterium Pan216]
MTSSSLKGILAFGLVGCLLVGCAEQGAPTAEPKETADPTDTTATDVKEQVNKTMQTAVDYMKAKKEDYVSYVNEQLPKWNAKLEDLKKQAAEATGDAKKELDKQIASLQQQIQDFKENQLPKLKDAASDAWRDVASGVHNATQQIDQAFHQMSDTSETKN